MEEVKPYGKELILDLHGCDVSLFNRIDLEIFFIKLCDLLKMQRCDLHFWDYLGQDDDYHNVADHLKGTSAIQFITTSNITIHTLDVLKAAYLNIFTCKDFEPEDAISFCKTYFKAESYNSTVVDRV